MFQISHTRNFPQYSENNGFNSGTSWLASEFTDKLFNTFRLVVSIHIHKRNISIRVTLTSLISHRRNDSIRAHHSFPQHSQKTLQSHHISLLYHRAALSIQRFHFGYAVTWCLTLKKEMSQFSYTRNLPQFSPTKCFTSDKPYINSLSIQRRFSSLWVHRYIPSVYIEEMSQYGYTLTPLNVHRRKLSIHTCVASFVLVEKGFNLRYISNFRQYSQKEC